ncbi:MAG: radical SAM protein [Deltaproteobacteria bacterium]|nr:radical SAM protein [Deltaproteobacteria bacterium]
MPRAAENYLRMAMGQKRLRGIEWAVNFDCFATCGHCSIQHLGAKHPDRPPMTVEQMQDGLRQCIELGALNINITGGEALLVPFLPEIVAACEPRRTVVSLATNGAPITPKTAANLAKWGVSIVTMSIDSADPERHDKSRGVKGCFKRLMDAIDFFAGGRRGGFSLHDSHEAKYARRGHGPNDRPRRGKGRDADGQSAVRSGRLGRR